MTYGAGTRGLILVLALGRTLGPSQPALLCPRSDRVLGLKLVATLDQVGECTRQEKGKRPKWYSTKGPKKLAGQKNGETNDKSGDQVAIGMPK